MTPSAHRLATAALLLLPALPLFADAPLPVHGPQGLVVQAVDARGTAARAGLSPGDILMAWRPRGRKGADDTPWVALQGPFALYAMEAATAAEPAVELQCHGSGGPFWAFLRQGPLGLEVRPTMAGDLESSYERGRLCGPANAPEALGLWERCTEEARGQGLVDLASWLTLARADLAFRVGKVEEARALCRAAADAGAPAGDPFAGAVALEKLGAGLLESRDWKGAAEAALEMRARARHAPPSALHEARALALYAAARLRDRAPEESRACLEEAEGLLRASAPGTADHAAALATLGKVCLRLGDLRCAEASLAEALALWEEGGWDRSRVAETMDGLGESLHERGDLEGAYRYLVAALEMRRELGERREEADTLDNLGVILKDMGDLPAAQACTEEALRTIRALAPGSRSEAAMLNSLGVLHRLRGDLEGAERHYTQAKALWDRLEPGGSGVANALGNLGFVARLRGDLDQAERCQLAGIEIVRKLSPGSLREASHLIHLGLVAYDRGDADAAAEYYNQALAIQQQRAPGSLLESYTRVDLGLLAHEDGRPEEAERQYGQALRIREGLAPGGLGAAECRFHLARLALDRGERALAREGMEAALAIQGRLAPESAEVAETLYILARMSREDGDLEAALAGLERSLAALEAQGGALGGGESALQRFSANYSDYYRDAVEVYLALGRDREAFQALERSKAQGLLRMLAERDLDFSKDVPAPLLDEKRHLAAEVEAVRYRLGELDPQSDPAVAEALARRLDELRGLQEGLAEKIKRASPAFGSLQYPQPLGVEAASRALGPGVLLLSYSVNRGGTTLFALEDGTLRVYPVAVTRDGLSTLARAFRRGLSDPLAPDEAFRRPARRLYDLLLAPARAEIAKAGVVLISPDGPLLGIPFSAFVTQEGRYVLEEKASAMVASATVYAEGRARTAADAMRTGRLLAFGDPAYGSGAAAGGRAQPPPPLPWSRTEVRWICSLRPGESRALLGPEATEGAAKRVGKGVALLHLACHGQLDRRLPLESGLLLSPPAPGEDDDGIWQAWEIFEGLRIDADLVTLSACETGLGKELGGEGLIGLTRAFQYAGARAVLSSLWGVSDESTALLMKRFYGRLAEGAPAAEALRGAQLGMMGAGAPPEEHPGGAARRMHPFYWAAFVLNGDWR